MNKRNVFLLGLLVLAMGVVMTGCMGVPKWDKNATDVSTLYIEESWTIIKLDGAGNFFLYGDKNYKGNGSIFDPEKPSDRDIKRLKPVLIIPAGEHQVTFKPNRSFNNTQSASVDYNFLPGKHYVILSMLDVDNYNVKSALVQDLSVMKFVVRDITDLKVKK
ncbi:MAG: hypothetical protein LBQ82_08695 [Treponema sp.]|jgi:hypothetical protein|nr:hypothetical protein [Treponema sp.]